MSSDRKPFLYHHEQAVIVYFECDALEASGIASAFMDAEGICKGGEVTTDQWIDSTSVFVEPTGEGDDRSHRVVIKTIRGVIIEMVEILSHMGISCYSSKLDACTLLQLYTTIMMVDSLPEGSNGYGFHFSPNTGA